MKNISATGSIPENILAEPSLAKCLALPLMELRRKKKSSFSRALQKLVYLHKIRIFFFFTPVMFRGAPLPREQ
jgi:hypothetical protein